MANRTAQELQKATKEKATLQIMGSGVSFPFRFSDHGSVRAVEVSQGLAKINQSIRVILSTSKGERVNRPTFGCFTSDTEVFVLPGKRVKIADLIGQGPIKSLGTVLVDKTPTSPSTTKWRITETEGVVSRGIKRIMGIKLSNDEYIRCTEDHLFLLNDYLTYCRADNLIIGQSLGWLDISDPNLKQRLYSQKRSITTPLGLLPTTDYKLWIKEIDPDLGEEEVFDLANSQTNNFLLAAGPIVHNSNLPKLVFEPNDEILLPLLQRETADALRIWEKRIQVTGIQFVNPDSLQISGNFYPDPTLVNELRNLAQEDSMIGIYINYIVLRNNQPGAFIFPFTRKTADWSYNIPQL